MTVPHAPATTPEAALWRFRVQGDPSAAGDLFDLTSVELFRVALTLAPDAASAEDALQETYIAALEAVDRFEDGRRVVPWLMGILRHKISRQHRDAARRPDPGRVPAPGAPLDPAAEAESREEHARVHAAIEELPEPYRSVALLRWRYGMDPAEIAHVRGEPPGTVRSLLHRAARKLEPVLGGLPAAIVGGAGGAGLDLVREHVVSAARAVRPGPSALDRAVPAAAGAGVGAGAASLLTGGLVMGKMLKIPAAVAALVVVAGGLSMLADPASAPEQGERRGDDGATADVAEDPGRKRVEKTPIDPAPEDDVQPAGALPAPVDLDACDRDRDVHGRVVSADGEPLPGATIATVRYPWRRTGFLNMEGYETGEPVDERLSAEDGTFAVRLRRGELVHLEVSADGYAPTKISQVQAGERLRVELSRPGTGAVGLTVRVLDEDGNLVPEANVHVFSLSGVTPVVNRKAVTDADGSAGFEGMPANSAVVIDVSAPDYGSPGWTQRRIASEPEQREEVTLPRGRTLRGRVTDTATGAPIAGAKVGMNWVQRHPVTSDEDGNFALPGWTGRGATEIVATAEGYGRQKHVVGEREVVDFALRAGDTVTGRLVTPAGKPVGGALVAAVGSQHDGTVQTSSFGHTISEPSGRFSVADLRRDLPHTLIVAAEGHGRTLYDFDPHAGAAGTIDLGDVIVHDGHSIEGVVVDADGEPMPRLMVIVQGANSDRGKLRSRAPTVDHFYGNSEDRYTDDQGRFRFPDLAPGTYLVKVRPHGAPEQQRSVTLHGEDVADLEIALNSGHRVKIMVLGPDGEPIAGAYVAPITGGGNTQTDGSGVGYLTLPRGANVQLSVFTMGSTNPEWVVPSAQMVSSSASEVTFQYKRAKLVRVRLLDPSGDPIEGAQVEARRGAELVRSGTTEADGRVTIKVSDEGPVDLTISPNKIIKEGRRMRWELLPFTGSAEGVRPGAEQETVIRCTALTFDAELTVRVVGPDDDAVSGAMIYIARPAMPGRQGLVTGADGRVHITELPSTEITVMAMLNADKLPEGWMPPKAGTATADGGELVLKFRRAMFVTGAVTLPDGKPAAKCVVDARRGEQAITAGQTDADGRFRLIVASDEEPFSVGATAIGEGAKMLRDAATGVRPGDDLRLSLKKE